MCGTFSKEGSTRLSIQSLQGREANDYLFIQPDVVQLLVQIMAWSNLPAFDIGPVRIDLIPP